MFKAMKKRNSNDFPVFVSGIPGRNNWVRINEFHNKYKRGDYVKIADNTGYSPSYVWRVLNGERGQNQTILAEARRMMYRRVSEYSFQLAK
jgi:hypothetical protein